MEKTQINEKKFYNNGYVHANMTGISYLVFQLNPAISRLSGEAKNSSKQRDFEIVDSKCRKSKYKGNGFVLKIKGNQQQLSSNKRGPTLFYYCLVLFLCTRKVRSMFPGLQDNFFPIPSTPQSHRQLSNDNPVQNSHRLTTIDPDSECH